VGLMAAMVVPGVGTRRQANRGCCRIEGRAAMLYVWCSCSVAWLPEGAMVVL
jgi:hypothetical protein